MKRPLIEPGWPMFLILLTMGAGTLAGGLLLPEWQQWQSLQEMEVEAEARMAALHELVDRERRLLDAMQSDPAVMDRLARRELGYERVGERPVPVPLAQSTGMHGDTIENAVASGVRVAGTGSSAMPEWVAAVLPPKNVQGIFLEPATRRILLIMAVVLLTIAFGLFVVRRQPAPA